MKWFLVVLTFWRPDISVSTVVLEYDNEQSCLDQQLVFEEKFAREYEAGSGFGYMLYCTDKDPYIGSDD